MAFDVGDKVIYPNHGLGVVETIEEKTIMGTTCGFYMLRMISSDTTVLVPVGNIESVGLRRAVSDDEIDRLYRRLANGKIDSIRIGRVVSRRTLTRCGAAQFAMP